MRVSVCVRVLWTHCLAKSLWGSLNRLCFPSGESIQVTDTESWLQSKWPLKSWKCFLTWHLTISDVAVGYKRRSDLELSALLAFFLSSFLRSRESVEGDVKIFSFFSSGVPWLYVNIKKVRLRMNRVPCTSQWRCCFLLLPPCLIWLIQVGSPDCFASLVWINRTRTRCSDGFWMMKAKTDQGADDALFTF